MALQAKFTDPASGPPLPIPPPSNPLVVLQNLHAEAEQAAAPSQKRSDQLLASDAPVSAKTDPHYAQLSADLIKQGAWKWFCTDATKEQRPAVQKDFDQLPPIRQAEVISHLVEQKQEVSLLFSDKHSTGRSVLHLASGIHAGDGVTVNMALSKAPEDNTPNPRPVMVQALTILLQTKMKTQEVFSYDNTKNNALHFAIARPQPDANLVRLLAAKLPAALTEANKEGRMPIDLGFNLPPQHPVRLFCEDQYAKMIQATNRYLFIMQTNFELACGARDVRIEFIKGHAERGPGLRVRLNSVARHTQLNSFAQKVGADYDAERECLRVSVPDLMLQNNIPISEDREIRNMHRYLLLTLLGCTFAPQELEDWVNNAENDDQLPLSAVTSFAPLKRLQTLYNHVATQLDAKQKALQAPSSVPLFVEHKEFLPTNFQNWFFTALHFRHVPCMEALLKSFEHEDVMAEINQPQVLLRHAVHFDTPAPLIRQLCARGGHQYVGYTNDGLESPLKYAMRLGKSPEVVEAMLEKFNWAEDKNTVQWLYGNLFSGSITPWLGAALQQPHRPGQKEKVHDKAPTTQKSSSDVVLPSETPVGRTLLYSPHLSLAQKLDVAIKLDAHATVELQLENQAATLEASQIKRTLDYLRGKKCDFTSFSKQRLGDIVLTLVSAPDPTPYIATVKDFLQVLPPQSVDAIFAKKEDKQNAFHYALRQQPVDLELVRLLAQKIACQVDYNNGIWEKDQRGMTPIRIARAKQVDHGPAVLANVIYWPNAEEVKRAYKFVKDAEEFKSLIGFAMAPATTLDEVGDIYEGIREGCNDLPRLQMHALEQAQNMITDICIDENLSKPPHRIERLLKQSTDQDRRLDSNPNRGWFSSSPTAWDRLQEKLKRINEQQATAAKQPSQTAVIPAVVGASALAARAAYVRGSEKRPHQTQTPPVVLAAASLAVRKSSTSSARAPAAASAADSSVSTLPTSTLRQPLLQAQRPPPSSQPG
jgi:hypothetical protein